MKSFSIYRILKSFLLMLLSITALAQEEKGMVIGDLILDPSAIVEMQSDDRGLLIPRMNTLQRDNNIQNPADGLLIFNEEVGLFNKYFGGTWNSDIDGDWLRLPSGTNNDIYHLGKVSVGAETAGNSIFSISSDPAIANRTFTVNNSTDGNRDFSIESDGRIGVVTSNAASLFNIRSKGVQDFIFSIEDNNGNDKFLVRDDGRAGINRAFSNTDFTIKAASTSAYSLLVQDPTETSYFIIRQDGRVSVGPSSWTAGSNFNVRARPGNSRNLSVQDTEGNFDFEILDNGTIGMGAIYGGVDLSIKGKPENAVKVLIKDSNNDDVFVITADQPQTSLIMYGQALKTGSPTWEVQSDRRLKSNIKEYEEGIDFINKIRPVWFTYNGLANTPEGAEYVGIIAQELQEVAPHMIKKMRKDEAGNEYLSVDTNAFTYMLINAVQEQQKEIESLESKYEDLLKRVEALEQQ